MYPIIARLSPTFASGAPGVLFGVPALSGIRLAVVASGVSGTANVYYSLSDHAKCLADKTSGNIPTGGDARWTAWAAGSVSGTTMATVPHAVVSAAAVASGAGTWALEIATNG